MGGWEAAREVGRQGGKEGGHSMDMAGCQGGN